MKRHGTEPQTRPNLKLRFNRCQQGRSDHSCSRKHAAQLPGLPGLPGLRQHPTDCAWSPSTEDIQPAWLADGYGWQTGDPFSEQDMGSPPCGAIDPAIDSARAEPSLDRTRRPRRPTRHHHGTVARKAAQHVSELQPCRFKVSSGAGVFREKTGEPAQPKTVLRGAANPGAGLRDQCPPPEAMAFE